MRKNKVNLNPLVEDTLYVYSNLHQDRRGAFRKGLFIVPLKLVAKFFCKRWGIEESNITGNKINHSDKTERLRKYCFLTLAYIYSEGPIHEYVGCRLGLEKKAGYHIEYWLTNNQEAHDNFCKTIEDLESISPMVKTINTFIKTHSRNKIEDSKVNDFSKNNITPENSSVPCRNCKLWQGNNCPSLMKLDAIKKAYCLHPDVLYKRNVNYVPLKRQILREFLNEHTN